MALFYKRYPSKAIVRKENRKEFRGSKKSKNKDRVTVMVCSSATEKVPLAMIGKADRPRIFDTLGTKSKPMYYNYQKNAWFDGKIMKWWLVKVFVQHIKEKRSENPTAHFVLILDNFLHTSKDEWAIVLKDLDFIHLLFLPPNLTSKHQPMDMGIIAILKVGYKTTMLKTLLDVCDDEENFQRCQQMEVASGCRGLQHGHVPHLLDAMNILNRLWIGDLAPRYSRAGFDVM